MDVCSTLSIALIILLNICDIQAHNDDLRSRKRELVIRVTDSACGTSYSVKSTIFFLYDGSPISDPGIITIINGDLRRHSKTCIKLDNVFIYDDSFQCRDVFRFYYGDYPPINITKYLSCSDIRQEVCDVDKTAYAVFNSQSSSAANIKFQIKVSATSEYSKRSNTSISDADNSVSNSLASRLPRRSWSSWDSWDTWTANSRSWTSWMGRSWTSWQSNRRRSWSSWKSWSPWSPTTSSYSNYKREIAEQKKSKVTQGIIGLSVFGSVLAIVLIWLAWAVRGDYCNRNRAGNEQNFHDEHSPFVSGRSANQGDTGYASNAVSPQQTHLTSEREENTATRSHHIPSAPPEESLENASVDIPPPAYSSLFPAPAYPSLFPPE